MHWLAGVLRANPELALFLAMALGHVIGSIRIGSFQAGSILGTLIAGLAIGQLGIPVSGPMKSALFLLFLFAIGFKSGPEFFSSLRSSALPQVGLTILMSVVGVATTIALVRLFGFDDATGAGLFAGAMTSSTALGTATAATASLGLDAAAQAALAQKIATAYALTYVFGVLLEVWFLPTIGPRLMRVNLREVSKQLEESGVAGGVRKPAASGQVAVRAYRITEQLEGRTVAEIESLCPEERRVIIIRLRRGNAMLDATLTTDLRRGDVVAVAGRSESLLNEAHSIGWQEVDDRELMAVPTISADLVLTNRSLAGQSLRDLVQQIGARGVFLSSLRRGGRELPFVASTVIERGDILNVYGTRAEVARVATHVGFVEYPTSATDLGLVSATIFVGGILGLLSFVIGGTSISLTTSVGVLVAGLTLGKLRTMHPRYGRIPEPAVSLFQAFGLSGFLALVGLQAGPGAVTAFQSLGISLVLAGAVITLLPHIVTILVGYYVVHLHPAVLLGLCAGAGISAPSLAALEKAADSKVPTLGYGVSCALGNALMALSGTLLVLASHG